MAGRRPIPTRLKIIKGTDQPCRIRKNEPKPADDAVDMPEGLSPVAQKQWSVICQQLQDAKIITNVDSMALALYCEAYATWSNANKMVQKHGAIVKGAAGQPVQSPYFKVANISFDQMRRMMVEFGITPAARSRISTTGPTEDDDEF